ncbi:phage holin family protein [Lacticaseibacillus daqingensis]|uniref:phage holin family protein n=1 Tax=Lacticaseibacillus daqingensis TaxID=2486014 RepID=UPI000F7954CB|nr:phage holin family protein [Lacticaseibacillus daqingensis]
MGFLRKVLLTTLVFVVYSQLFPAQLYVASLAVAVTGAVVLGVLNGLVKPILKVLSFPLTLLTLGLFLLILNAFMLTMMTWFVDGIIFASFGAKLLLAIVLSVVNATLGEPNN